MASSVIKGGDAGGLARGRTRAAHVLAVPFSGLVGHVNPLMNLCQQLAAEGVAITFAYPQSYYERLQAIMSQSPNAGGDGALCSGHDNIRVVGVEDGLAYQEYLTPDSPRLESQAAIDVEDKLVELAHLSAQQYPVPFTCVIADVFVLCASSVAQRLGIPYVAFWTQSAACFAAHIVATKDYITLKGRWTSVVENGTARTTASDEQEFMKAPECIFDNIPGCSALKVNELPTFLQSLDPEEHFFSYLTKCFANVEEEAGCSRVLLNTFDELEPESMGFIHNRQKNTSAIGPLLPREYMMMNNSYCNTASFNNILWPAAQLHAAAHDESLTWLDTQKPKSVLFVSFGSLALLSQPQLEELAAGLEASGCKFLMVVRKSLMDGHSARFPIGFEERLLSFGQALFVSWAPQLQVLAHPSIGAFLTHSGWNSTLEGISQGLPFLCWPYFADQMLNSRCVADVWQIGLQLKDEIPTNSSQSSSSSTNAILVSRHSIEAKIKSLMDPSSSASIRQRCKQFHMAASKAVLHDQGSSHLKLKSFIAWLQEKGMRLDRSVSQT